jgi:hypothetical protein
MGNDAGSADGAPPPRRQTGSHSTRKALSPALEWGPNGLQHSHAGTSTLEEHMDRVRDAKRRGLLNANGHSMPDSTGRFKRRNSDDINSAAENPEGDNEEPVLVYVHHVKIGDTLAGLTIRYSCQPAILRRANRMWPNDPIQSRKLIMVPVDACSVKGKKVDGPHVTTEQRDLLGDSIFETAQDPTQQSNGCSDHPFQTTSQTASTHPDDDPPWKHDSWVLLPNDKTPTEIVRLPRQDLGYFPRARRKSLTQSGLSTPRTTSLDLSRSAIAPPPATPPAIKHARAASRTPPPAAGRRASSLARRGRSASAAGSSAAASPPPPPPAPPAFLTGPGGVGDLVSGSARAPGPGPDRLADLLGPALPRFVAPPPHMTAFTPWAPGLLSPGGDGVCPPGAAASAAAGGLDLQDVGGAIEGWVRRVARRAASALEAGSGGAGGGGAAAAVPAAAAASGNVGVRAMALGGGGLGDLIELVDAFEVGDESDAGGEASVLAESVGQKPGTASVSAWNVGGAAAGEMRGRRQGR